MDWKRYLSATLWFNALGFVAVYALQRLQDVLPLNPQQMGAVSPDSSFNTAVSFATNTNWQGYGGESTMSYLTQMLGLGVQNFLSAATGMAVFSSAGARFCPQAGQWHRQLLGGHDAFDGLHPAAAVADAGMRARHARAWCRPLSRTGPSPWWNSRWNSKPKRRTAITQEEIR